MVVARLRCSGVRRTRKGSVLTDKFSTDGLRRWVISANVTS